MIATRVVVKEPGAPEVLQVESVEVPSPAAGQVLVRHTAIGVNFIDTYHRSGSYPLPHYPHGIGTEGVGVVEAVGPNTTEVAVGQRVGYLSGPLGSYASHRLLEAERCVVLPDDIADDVAARSLLKGITAHILLTQVYKVQSNNFVLWHAAAGGTGLIAVQWLKHLGARVIGTVGSDEKAELAQQHGCEFTVVYSRESFVERVKEITDGALVPVVYDSVGKNTLADSLLCVAPRGTLVSFGNSSGKPDAVEVSALAARGSLFLTRPRVFDYTATRAELLNSAHALFEVLRSGAVKSLPGPTFALTEAPQAHRALESRQTTGSLLLVP